MDQRSLEDLLALITVRNVTRATERRNISQPAFSRRLQAIEAQYGTLLVDRTKRPAVPTPALDAMQFDIEAALVGLKRLSNNLKTGPAIDQILSIAAVHSLSSGPIPIAISTIRKQLTNHQIRLKSANHDICFQMLMTQEVSLMIAYETPSHVLQGPPDLIKKTVVTTEQLVPVCKAAMAKEFETLSPGSRSIPLISYPNDIFLGRIMSEDILPYTPHLFTQRLSAGLSSAVLSSVRAGLGVGWLPASLIAGNRHDNGLAIIRGAGFPTVDLTISMLQLRTRSKPDLTPLWQAFAGAIADTIAPRA